jgi:hypothetical protein
MAAHEVHNWIVDQLKVTDGPVAAVQIDPIKRQVFIKFDDPDYAPLVVQRTNGAVTCKHSTGEITTVQIDLVGLGLKRVRVANVPPESGQERFRTALAPYGEVRSVYEEKWSNAYRLAVVNGVRIVTMILKKHIPSHMMIAGHRALISYEGQPATCYHCGDTGHMYLGCPKRRTKDSVGARVTRRTWADIVANEVGAEESIEPPYREPEGAGPTQPEQETDTDVTDGGTAREMEAVQATMATETMSESVDEAAIETIETYVLPEMAGEPELTSDTTTEMEADDHNEGVKKTKTTKIMTSRKHGKGNGGGRGGRLGGTLTGRTTVAKGSEIGTEPLRNKKQRLDRSEEKLDWKRTRIRGAQSLSQ